MKHYRLFFAAALVSLLASCTHRQEPGPEMLALSNDVLSDTTNYWHPVLSATPVGKEGSIAVIGQEEDALGMGYLLMTADLYDNGSGRREEDLLPDFCGEHVDVYADMALESGYSSFVASGNVDLLREEAVYLALAALDTRCWENEFESEPRLVKTPAKAIVIASPTLSAYGASDVRELLAKAGLDIPVIDPAHALLDAALDRHEHKAMFGVMTSLDTLGVEIYDKALRDKDFDGADVRFFVDKAQGETVKDKFYAFLESYAQRYSRQQMCALLIDSLFLSEEDLALLDEALVQIRTIDTEEMVRYRNLIGPDFTFVSLGEAVAAQTYRLLRERGELALRISYPQMNGYSTIFHNDFFYVFD